jgi:hypothetical protein
MINEDVGIKYSILNSKALDNNGNKINSGKQRYITLYTLHTGHDKLEIIIPGFLFYKWKHKQILRNIDSNIEKDNITDIKDYILVNYKDTLPKNIINKKQIKQNIVLNNTENFANNIAMQIKPEMLQKYKRIRIIGISTGCNLVLPMLKALIARVNQYNNNEKEKGVYERKTISPEIELDFKITPALPKYNSILTLWTGVFKSLVSYKSQPNRLNNEVLEFIQELKIQSEIKNMIIENNIIINIAKYVDDNHSFIHSKKELPSITELRNLFNSLSTIINQNVNQLNTNTEQVKYNLHNIVQSHKIDN